MYPHRNVVKAELRDKTAAFRLDVLSWGADAGDGGAEHLVVGLEIVAPGVDWQGRATAVMAPELSELAAAANDSLRGSGQGHASLSSADPNLGFSFHFDPLQGIVHVSVIVDDKLRPDEPSYPDDYDRTVLLRVPPEEVFAFAEALESIAEHNPARVHWVG